MHYKQACHVIKDGHVTATTCYETTCYEAHPHWAAKKQMMMSKHRTWFDKCWAGCQQSGHGMLARPLCAHTSCIHGDGMLGWEVAHHDQSILHRDTLMNCELVHMVQVSHTKEGRHDKHCLHHAEPLRLQQDNCEDRILRSQDLDPRTDIP